MAYNKSFSYSNSNGKKIHANNASARHTWGGRKKNEIKERKEVKN
jgi:hypothetical protein